MTTKEVLLLTVPREHTTQCGASRGRIRIIQEAEGAKKKVWFLLKCGFSEKEWVRQLMRV